MKTAFDQQQARGSASIGRVVPAPAGAAGSAGSVPARVDLHLFDVQLRVVGPVRCGPVQRIGAESGCGSVRAAG